MSCIHLASCIVHRSGNLQWSAIPFLITVLFAGILTGPSAHAQAMVWVVDDNGGPGVDFLDIQPAIDAAADDDFIWVKDGAYTSIFIDGNHATSNAAVIIFSVAGDTVTLSGNITIQNLGDPEHPDRVVLRGIDSTSAGSNTLSNCTGNSHIWIEECDLAGPDNGLDIDTCSAVILVRSSFTGASGDAGGHGLDIQESEVAIWHSQSTGGDSNAIGQQGGNGLTVGANANVFASGGSCTGGQGGDGDPPALGCTPPGQGGHGTSTGSTGSFEYQAVTSTGGPGGAVISGCSGSSQPGDAFHVEAGGVLTSQPGFAYRTETDSAHQYNNLMTFSVHGLGDAGLQVMTRHIPNLVPSTPPLIGWAAIELPASIIHSNVIINPSTWVDSFQATLVPTPGIEGQAGYVQTGIYALTTGQFFTTSPTIAIFFQP